MQKSISAFKFNTGVVGYPLLFVLLIWIVFWVEIRFNFDFSNFGIYPRTLVGSRGIFFSPFIHGDIFHLWHNTLPLLILSAALFFFYQKNSWNVLFFGLLGTGLITWVIGRDAHHIGASGVIYMLFGFLFFKGIFAKHFRLIALSLIVVFIYGSMMMYVLPIDPKISWEGHLSGLIIGAILALFIKKGVVKPPKYEWEKEDFVPEEDDFLKHFDENGNFIEFKNEDDTLDQGNVINYIYIDSTKDQKKE